LTSPIDEEVQIGNDVDIGASAQSQLARRTDSTPASNSFVSCGQDLNVSPLRLAHICADRGELVYPPNGYASATFA
jgi:hypothetical protein